MTVSANDASLSPSIIDLPRRPPSPLPPATHRFVFIDGLRGIAAMIVMIFHFFVASEFQASLNLLLPLLFVQVLKYGYLGVEIFFVLSGFVMAHSQRNARINPPYLGNFALRRSLRLDPAYWLSLILALAFSLARVHLLGDSHAFIPSWRQMLANVFYLQLFLGSRAVNDVAWTLCYEVQFYLVISLLNSLSQYCSRKFPNLIARWLPVAARSQNDCWRLLVFAPLALASLFPVRLHLNLPGLFIEYWYMFFLGVLVQWVYDRKVHPAWFVGYATLVALCLIGGGGPPRIAALVTAASIFAVAKLRRLDSLLAWRPLQFLGRISYSLYLLHSVLITPILLVGFRLTGGSAGSILAWTLFAIAASIGGATLMYYFVEKPGVDLGRRLRTA
jgi:peptidoglycan/LPS O-acetylase OafA/YrhL